MDICNINCTFRLGSVGGDGVEDVDEHEEESDQERHPPGDDVRRNHEAGQAVRFCSGQECHVGLKGLVSFHIDH